MRYPSYSTSTCSTFSLPKRFCNFHSCLPVVVVGLFPSPLRSQLDLELPVMASRMLRTQPLRCANLYTSTFPAASSRSFASVAARGLRQNPAIKRSTLTAQQPLLRQSFRRQYADNQAPQAILSPKATPKKRWGFFKTLWRITYISLLGGTAYLFYTVYDLKYPTEQFDPDPSKKTLVVLGKIQTQ